MDGYDVFINDYELTIEKGDPNEEEYQGLPDYPELKGVVYNINEYKESNSHWQYIGYEVVLPNWKYDKRMGTVTKYDKYDDISTREGHYNEIQNKSV